MEKYWHLKLQVIWVCKKATTMQQQCHKTATCLPRRLHFWRFAAAATAVTNLLPIDGTLIAQPEFCLHHDHGDDTVSTVVYSTSLV